MATEATLPAGSEYDSSDGDDFMDTSSGEEYPDVCLDDIWDDVEYNSVLANLPYDTSDLSIILGNSYKDQAECVAGTSTVFTTPTNRGEKRKSNDCPPRKKVPDSVL